MCTTAMMTTPIYCWCWLATLYHDCVLPRFEWHVDHGDVADACSYTDILASAMRLRLAACDRC